MSYILCRSVINTIGLITIIPGDSHMDDLFTVVGRLYIEVTRLQQYVEVLQKKIQELEVKNQELDLGLANAPAPSKIKDK
jgi:hypothetical protein